MWRDDGKAVDARDLSDRALLERMRKRDGGALREFAKRFYPLLSREARGLGVQTSLRDEIVLQCLDDSLTTLLRARAPVPRSLAGYLCSALRHDVINARRDERRRSRRYARAVSEASGNEWVVAEACSEDSLRASAGQQSEAPSLSPALERLAAALLEGLTSEERSILTWLGHWVPQRVMAEWLGKSYGAMRVQVVRLRARLKQVATRHAGTLAADEQREMTRFFRRMSRAEMAGTPGTDRREEPAAVGQEAPLVHRSSDTTKESHDDNA
jgi:hypothetical protein